MHLVIIGLNHRTAAVEIREKLRIAQDQLSDAIAELKQRPDISECLILSTCNRTEVYACTTTRAQDTAIIEWIGEFRGVEPAQFASHLYSHAGHKAAEHLFRVSSGIDSMVLGEAQVLGQVKEAYAAAGEAGGTGPVLNSLFQQAITVGKRVRTETEIGRGAFSVCSVAVQLARSIFDELTGRTVLIVGAGKMAELTLTHLTSFGASNVVVANRTHESAADLATRVGGRAVRFEDIPLSLEIADVVITSTGAQEPIITKKAVASAMHERRGRPMFFIDIAVPRDIEAGVGGIDNVFLYNIDDLQAGVETHANNRRTEVAKVEQIIAEEVEQFTLHFKQFDAVPVITAMREKLEGIRLQELEKLRSKLRDLSAKDMEAINAATRSIVNKICHQPMIRMKEYAAESDSEAKLETVCELFGICPVEDQAAAEESETS
ncbi:MAG: glutamyl-tRNA reductase [Armatimonadetes bacterium RBG_16_58_9]|nr:MAG: glutamyl-tRNA reductase [Armatimonadetes bacterium RBG_16_58_9]